MEITKVWEEIWPEVDNYVTTLAQKMDQSTSRQGPIEGGDQFIPSTNLWEYVDERLSNFLVCNPFCKWDLAQLCKQNELKLNCSAWRKRGGEYPPSHSISFFLSEQIPQGLRVWKSVINRNQQTITKSCLPLVFENKILLQHSYTHLIIYCLQLFHATMTELSDRDRDYLAKCRKGLSSPFLEPCYSRFGL